MAAPAQVEARTLPVVEPARQVIPVPDAILDVADQRRGIAAGHVLLLPGQELEGAIDGYQVRSFPDAKTPGFDSGVVMVFKPNDWQEPQVVESPPGRMLKLRRDTFAYYVPGTSKVIVSSPNR